MGIIRSLTEKRDVNLENPRTSLGNPAAWLIDIFGGGKSLSGVSVSERTALTSVPVAACVRVLAEGVASLPLPVYKKLTPRGKERAPDHPLYELLHDRPNPEMSSFAFRETLQAHVVTWGNAFAEIESDGAGRPVALWPITPDRVRVVRRNQQKVYIVKVDGHDKQFSQDEILHIPGLGFDGMVGYSVISMARNAIGLALATEEFGSRFFSNGATPGGILTHPGKLSDPAQKRVKASWNEAQGGLSNAQRVAILEEGMKWEKIGIPPEDAQFLETRKFQVAEIARIFRVPPHMVGDLERATFSNVEQQSIDFVVHTLRPWLVRWEQVLNYDLFTEADRKQYCAEFLVDGLLRGDMAARFNAYKIGRDGGWLSADDIREMENQNPLPGEQGKIYIVPLNVAPADSLGKNPPASSDPAAPPGTPASTTPAKRRPDEGLPTNFPDAPAKKKVRSAFEGVVTDAARRILRREASAANRAAKKGQKEFEAWLGEFYAENYAERQLEPVVRSFAGVLGESETFLATYAAGVAQSMRADSVRELSGLDAATIEAEVARITSTWEEKRATEIAERQTSALFDRATT